MNQKDRQKLKKKCDALWSKVTKVLWIKQFGPSCAWCVSRPGVHSDHIMNRWKHNTRWVVDNMILLCAGCHLFRKKREPAEWAMMVIKYIGQDRFDALYEESQKVVEHQDYQKIYEYLKSCEAMSDLDKGKPEVMGARA